MKVTATQQKILEAAESLIQKRGYNGFSYKDLTEIIGIKTSSIHYHYPTKENLACAVIIWQLENLTLILNEIKMDSELNAKSKILKFFDVIMLSTYADDMKMCLGGMFASDALLLPESVLLEVRAFFNYLSSWVKGVLIEGKKQGEIKEIGSTDEYSKYLLSQIEGALLLSRLFQNKHHLSIARAAIEQAI